MIVVIRLRGSVDRRKEIKDTLAMLRLHRKMHAVLLDEKNESVMGMVQKTKDWITWGEINDNMLKKLIKKRARKSGNKRITEKEADELFSKLKSGEKIKNMDIKPVFRLSPPSKGFKKSIKQHFPNGELGCRKEKINSLLRRMI